MKGWVYVISNEAMPGLVKVGYSTKDPELRAAELGHTGSPHPYTVEYEMLIEEPYNTEKEVHKRLAQKREGKEWFRCSAEEAVAAIKIVSGDRAIGETYKRVERSKANALQLRKKEEREIREVLEQAENDAEERFLKESTIIQREFEEDVATSCPARPFWNYWVCGGIVVMSTISILFPNITMEAAVLVVFLGGGVVGLWLQNHFEKRRKESESYNFLQRKLEEKLAGAEKTRDERITEVRKELAEYLDEPKNIGSS